MASIDTKMSVTGLSQYKNAMNQAAQSVKTLDAQLKQNEAQYKASGDREKYMSQQAKLLEDKLKAQKAAAKSAQDALKQMKAQGVDPMNQSYQKFAQQLAQAETGVLETSAAINSLGKSEQEAAKGADQLTASVQGISKKISLGQVIDGVNKITTGLENAAKKAVELGNAFADMIMESAARGDNIATMASILGMDIGDYQRYQKVFDTVADITVQDWRRAQDKIRKAMTDPSQDQINVLRLLGVSTSTLQDTGGGILEPVSKGVEDVLWDVGMAIRRDVQSGKITMLEADDMANAIFGKNFANLNPLFDLGREAFQAALDAQNVMDEESVKKLAELNDTVIKLKGDFASLQDEIMAGMAPALTKAAEVLDELLGKLMDYLKTEQGQAMLDRLGEAVSGLFEDLANIDPENVVNNFVNVFDKLVTSFEWISNNWSGVETGLKAIVGVWAGGKVISGALTLVELINGLKGLKGGGGVMSALGGSGGSVAGSLTGIFKNAIIGALPALGTIALGTLAITAGAVILGGSFNAQQVLEDAKETGKQQNEALDKFNETVGAASKNEELKTAHGTLAGYIVPRGKAGMEDLKDLQEFARRYVTFLRDFGDDALMDKVSDIVFDKGQEYAEEFQQAMEAVLANENDYSGETQQKVMDMVTDLMDAVRQQMAKEILTVELEPDVEGLQRQLSQVKLTANVAMNLGTGGMAGAMAALLSGNHANGLPFVPWDGYIAMLHRGERVLTASQNRNYTYNNHNYFGNVNLNNGMEVDALADSIAKQTRKQSRGYGD